MVIPLTDELPPFEFAPMMFSCLGPAGKLPLTAGTWMTIVSGVEPAPGVQLDHAAVGPGQGA